MYHLYRFGNVVPVFNKIKLIYSEIPPEPEDEIDIEEGMDQL